VVYSELASINEVSPLL